MKSCSDICDHLHAYRAGELSPLSRQRIIAHLDNCSACASELWLQTQLENSAKAGPEPLTDGAKERVLRNVHRELEDQAEPTQTRVRRLWPFIFAPVSLAAAATILMVFFHNDEGLTVATTALLEPQPGITLYATDGTHARLAQENKTSRILLEHGAVFVELDPSQRVSKVEVQTAHATVIVRGTVFYVNATDNDTRVGVRRGKVEARTAGGQSILIESGQELRVGDQLRWSDLDPLTLEALNRVIAEEPAPPALAHTTEPSHKEGRPALNKPRAIPRDVEKPAASRTGKEILQTARKLWKQGERDKAVALINETLPQLDDVTRLEALYLLAGIYRKSGDYIAANEMLNEVGRGESTTARLARLERARLLLHKLDDKKTARNILKALSEGTDTISNEAHLELCAIDRNCQLDNSR